MLRRTVLALAAAVLACTLPPAACADIDVLAIYFGDWHVDPDMSAIHGANWTEWNLVTTATPRYPGHLQPNMPMDAPGFGLPSREDDPSDMAKKVATTKSYGIDGFLFDWYWYAEKGPQGGTFLNGALDAFLKMSSPPEDFRFALMWANQDWVDIHPAKRGWSNTYRPPPSDLDAPASDLGAVAALGRAQTAQTGPPYGPRPRVVPGANGAPAELLMFDGFMSAEVYQAAFEFVAKSYFTRPNYYRAPTKLANGTVAQCAYFSFYQPEIFAGGVGGAAKAAELLNQFRATAESVGQCLHLALMTNTGMGGDKFIKQWDVASMTTYNFGKVTGVRTFPETSLEDVTTDALAAWAKLRDHYNSTYDVAFAPSASVAWDSSPRCAVSDPFLPSAGYPWGAAFHSTPAEFEASLQRVKAYMQNLEARGAAPSATGGAWLPPLLINAMNEWSEGAYLEPDQRYGFGKMQAINATFGEI